MFCFYLKFHSGNKIRSLKIYNAKVRLKKCLYFQQKTVLDADVKRCKQGCEESQCIGHCGPILKIKKNHIMKSKYFMFRKREPWTIGGLRGRPIPKHYLKLKRWLMTDLGSKNLRSFLSLGWDSHLIGVDSTKSKNSRYE